MDILLSVDVPAFFSGCMTTTVNTVFPDLGRGLSRNGPDRVCRLRLMTHRPERSPYKHSSDAVRFRSFTGNMYEALDLLETYRRDHSALVTSRLHCYLPMRSIGAEVDFRPKNRSDIRFAGLIDITDDQFDAIRSGINDRLERIFAAIMEGGSREEVYGLWRELCRPRCRARPREACCSPCDGCADDRCQRRDPASDRGQPHPRTDEPG